MLCINVQFRQETKWILCNPTPEFSDILWHQTKICDPKAFLLTKIKPEYSDILYNPTHFPGPCVCQIRQVPLYFELMVFQYKIFLPSGLHMYWFLPSGLHMYWFLPSGLYMYWFLPSGLHMYWFFTC